MGRNIFQAEDPVAMIQAVRKVVHDSFKPAEANDFYMTLRKEREKQGRPRT
jgi:putative autoinducer-2 (AI-2) aldolase